MRISYVRWNLLCVMFASVRDADLKMSQFAMWSNVLTFESTPRCVYKHDGSDTPKMTAVCVHYSFVLVCTVSIFVHTRHICCFFAVLMHTPCCSFVMFIIHSSYVAHSHIFDLSTQYVIECLFISAVLLSNILIQIFIIPRRHDQLN